MYVLIFKCCSSQSSVSGVSPLSHFHLFFLVVSLHFCCWHSALTLRAQSVQHLDQSAVPCRFQHAPIKHSQPWYFKINEHILSVVVLGIMAHLLELRDCSLCPWLGCTPAWERSCITFFGAVKWSYPWNVTAIWFGSLETWKEQSDYRRG